MANLNFLNEHSLYQTTFMQETAPIVIIGDKGGITDYFLWYSKKNDIEVKCLLLPEPGFAEHKFRREIKEEVENKVVRLGENSLESIEDVAKLTDIVNKITAETDNLGAMLFIANKSIPYKRDELREPKIAKFYLINSILALSTLGTGGNFIIKLYDCFTSWTNSLLYMLFLNFQSIAIVKPYSSRGYSSSRYLVCRRLIEENSPFIAYLTSLLQKTIELEKTNKTLEFLFPLSSIIKDERFVLYVMEANADIIERQIENLQEMKAILTEDKQNATDKEELKMRCLKLWSVPIINVVVNNSERQPERNKGLVKHNSVDELEKIYKNFDEYEKDTEVIN